MKKHKSLPVQHTLNISFIQQLNKSTKSQPYLMQAQNKPRFIVMRFISLQLLFPQWK